MPHCKHIIQNSGLFCQNNATTTQGYCRTHYEKRIELSVTAGYSFTTTTTCQTLFRGQNFCNTPSVPGLINNMCQGCYDKAKEKRKKLIEEEKERSETLVAIFKQGNRAFATYAIALQRLRDNVATIANIVFESLVEDFYYYWWWNDLTLEERRNLVHELETNLYPQLRLVIPNADDVARLRAWCENEDDHIFLERPVVRFTPRPPTPPTLQQIAKDSQNVHITAVVQQSNTTVDKLLKIAEKNTTLERVPDFFAAKWLLKKYGAWGKVKPVVEDMIIWYNTPLCKKQGDWLYRRVLHGLYIYWDGMKDKDIKRELLLRIFQECRESVGHCCEGHIARLANALVGFDEEAKPQVSTGEILQQKMANIANMKGIGESEKRNMAIMVFAELNIPADQQQAWLDAF